MTVHELKTWPEPFQATLEGKKPFEIRKNDRDYKVGDELRQREWAPSDFCRVCFEPATCFGRYEGKGAWEHGCDKHCGHGNGRCVPLGYSGREMRTVVTYIVWGPAWGLPPDMVVMGIRSPLDDNELRYLTRSKGGAL